MMFSINVLSIISYEHKEAAECKQQHHKKQELANNVLARMLKCNDIVDD